MIPIYIVVGILIFIIARYSFKNLFPKFKHNLLTSTITTIVLTPIISIALFELLLFAFFYEYHPDRKFNTESWTNNIQERHQMRDDILESKILLDKSKDEIAQIIGLPNNKTMVAQDTLSKWRYSLGGRGWGLGLKFYQLNIDFDNGKSSKVAVIENID